ncbi:hypothetical protein FB45DRAFT_906709 [Roridomyces roridus]|uniref:Zn(2)-C6 fungal-type domain-containing protein n=1 Tax=Roridomyces roridus TaxID=1738132 RepID=A0AAD7FTD0_9AGAR|nr:hypothetical protein FB45DRAFT_906709 [Roridomyces roridus]
MPLPTLSVHPARPASMHPIYPHLQPTQPHLGDIHLSPATPSPPPFTPSPLNPASQAQGQQTLKFSHANSSKAGGRTKKQALSCFFCRERKIACGRPEGGVGPCNQCARRKQECSYPTVSHRGQHSRIKSAARKAGVFGPDTSPGPGPVAVGGLGFHVATHLQLP